MLLLEEKCPRCCSNLILSEEGYTLTCEDCGAADTAKMPQELNKILLHCGVAPPRNASLKILWLILKNIAKEYGPIDKRHRLTLAGKSLIIIFRSNAVIPVEAECEEIDDAFQASKGLVDDGELLKHLTKEGFIVLD